MADVIRMEGIGAAYWYGAWPPPERIVAFTLDDKHLAVRDADGWDGKPPLIRDAPVIVRRFRRESYSRLPDDTGERVVRGAEYVRDA